MRISEPLALIIGLATIWPFVYTLEPVAYKEPYRTGGICAFSAV